MDAGKQAEHFRRMGAQLAEEERRWRIADAKRDPAEKLAEGIRMSDAAFRGRDRADRREAAGGHELARRWRALRGRG
ncbi:MAG: hypothetical protein ACOZNI_34155 [Myxococcota bacterium]